MYVFTHCLNVLTPDRICVTWPRICATWSSRSRDRVHSSAEVAMSAAISTTTARATVRALRVVVGCDGADVEGADGAPIGSAGASGRSGSVIGEAYGCASATAAAARPGGPSDELSRR